MIYDFLKNIELLYPAVLGLLAIVPFIIWWQVKKENKLRAAFPVSAAGHFKVETFKIKFRWLPFALRIFSICLIIIALARPQKIVNESRNTGEGIDIMLCMDVSGSMNARDVYPSRMEVATEVAIDFIQNRLIDRIGVVIFSGESFSQCPLTTDKSTLITQIKNLKYRTYLETGTVIGEGLATAVDRLWNSTTKTKIIILITDGKENPGNNTLLDPYAATRIAQAQKIKVYTIGIGSPAVATSPTISNQDPEIGYLDEKLLRDIAQKTGGRYFRAYNKLDLQDVYTEISLLEKSKVEVVVKKHVEEMFHLFLIAALGVLFLEQLLRATIFKTLT